MIAVFTSSLISIAAMTLRKSNHNGIICSRRFNLRGYVHATGLSAKTSLMGDIQHKEIGILRTGQQLESLVP